MILFLKNIFLITSGNCKVPAKRSVWGASDEGERREKSWLNPTLKLRLRHIQSHHSHKSKQKGKSGSKRADFSFPLVSKITRQHCSHENCKTSLSESYINFDDVLKAKTLLVTSAVHAVVKAMEIGSTADMRVKYVRRLKVEELRVFQLVCWRRPLRVLDRRPNQSIPGKEINFEYSTEGTDDEAEASNTGHLM